MNDPLTRPNMVRRGQRSTTTTNTCQIVCATYMYLCTHHKTTVQTSAGRKARGRCISDIWRGKVLNLRLKLVMPHPVFRICFISVLCRRTAVCWIQCVSRPPAYNCQKYAREVVGKDFLACTPHANVRIVALLGPRCVACTRRVVTVGQARIDAFHTSTGESRLEIVCLAPSLVYTVEVEK